MCLDLFTGALEWERTVVAAPLEKKHQLNSHASGTPVTDGELVYASFLQPAGKPEAVSDQPDRFVSPGDLLVAAYDFGGRPKWVARPGGFSSIHGFCSSPILYGDKLIINGDHDGESYLVALNRFTGQTVWKTAREHKTRSYVTPIVRPVDGQDQLVLSGSLCVTGYNPENGSRIWFVDGPTEQFVASPVFNGDLWFVTAGFPEYHIVAIRPGGRGRITDTHIAWRTTKGCAYVPSPILSDRYFLVVSDNGIGSCFEANTGRKFWMERLGSGYSASLVSANGLIYATADDGVTKVIRPAEQLEIVAVNSLGESVSASPAISQGRFLLRGESHLYCIVEPPPKKSQ
jgi:outer membrane protein assembly factor BamB